MLNFFDKICGWGGLAALVSDVVLMFLQNYIVGIFHPEDSEKTMQVLRGSSFIAIGVCFSLWLGYGVAKRYTSYQRLKDTGIASEGAVNKIETIITGKDKNGRPEIKHKVFATFIDRAGKEHVVEIDYFSGLKEGTKIPVRYHPDNPADFTMTGSKEIVGIAIMSLLFLVFGLGLIVSGILACKGMLQITSSTW